MAYDDYKLNRLCICVVLPCINLAGVVDYD